MKQYSDLRVECLKIIDSQSDKTRRELAYDMLDILNEVSILARDLECDFDFHDMLFAIQKMRRELDRQRRAISELRKGTGESGAWGGWGK